MTSKSKVVSLFAATAEEMKQAGGWVGMKITTKQLVELIAAVLLALLVVIVLVVSGGDLPFIPYLFS